MGNRVVITSIGVVSPLGYSPEDIIKHIKEVSNDDKFKEIENVQVYHHNGMYKYTSGNHISFAEAIKLQNEIRSHRKYKDAFIVAFKDGERIDVETARKLTGQ